MLRASSSGLGLYGVWVLGCWVEISSTRCMFSAAFRPGHDAEVRDLPC